MQNGMGSFSLTWDNLKSSFTGTSGHLPNAGTCPTVFTTNVQDMTQTEKSKLILIFLESDAPSHDNPKRSKSTA